MKCEKCSQDNPDDARLCSWCGSELEHPMGGDYIPQRNLGGLINHTFTIYFNNFRWFLMLSVPVMLFNILLFVFISDTVSEFEEITFEDVPGELVRIFVSMAGLAILGGLVYVLNTGAVIHAVGTLYSGRLFDPITSYRYALGKLLFMIVSGFIAVVIVMLGAFLIFILIGIPIVIFLVISLAFIYPVIVIEKAGPIEAIGKSFELVKGSRWRLFGLGIVWIVMNIVIAAVAEPLEASLGEIHELVGWFGSALIQGVISPISTIAITVVYFDLRTRKQNLTSRSLAAEMNGDSEWGEIPGDSLTYKYEENE